jgi:hypothetical protein
MGALLAEIVSYFGRNIEKNAKPFPLWEDIANRSVHSLTVLKHSTTHCELLEEPSYFEQEEHPPGLKKTSVGTIEEIVLRYASKKSIKEALDGGRTDPEYCFPKTIHH